MTERGVRKMGAAVVHHIGVYAHIYVLPNGIDVEVGKGEGSFHTSC